jgi:hypothetical protein
LTASPWHRHWHHHDSRAAAAAQDHAHAGLARDPIDTTMNDDHGIMVTST